MKDLIKITEQDGKQLVSARELHFELGVNRRFDKWVNYYLLQSVYFQENEDYVFMSVDGHNSKRGRTPIDYAITIDTAKKLAMTVDTEKGNIVRDYFIECEKKLKQPKELSRIELLTIALEAEKKVIELEKTKAQISDKKTATAMATASVAVRKAKKLEIKLDESLKYATIKRVEIATGKKYKWRDLKKKSEKLDKPIKNVPDVNYVTVKAYHCDVWLDEYGVDLKSL